MGKGREFGWGVLGSGWGGYLTEDDRGRGHSVRLVHGYLPCGRNENVYP